MTKNLVGAGYEKLEIGSGQDMSFSKENFNPDLQHYFLLLTGSQIYNHPRFLGEGHLGGDRGSVLHLAAPHIEVWHTCVSQWKSHSAVLIFLNSSSFSFLLSSKSLRIRSKTSRRSYRYEVELVIMLQCPQPSS